MRWPSLRPFVGMLAGWGVEEQLEVGAIVLGCGSDRYKGMHIRERKDLGGSSGYE
jgi:hypothetical protein